MRQELADRFQRLHHLRGAAHRGVDGARVYVQAMLGLQVWAHGLHEATRGPGHASSRVHDAG